MTNWAFLGAGSMAGAMVRGLIASRACTARHITCLSGSGRTAEALARTTGVRAVTEYAELLAGADVLIVACKPQNLATLDPSLAPLTAGKLVVSILAGKRLVTLARVFPGARNLVRTMPNTPGQIGAGVTTWCAHAPLNDDDRATLSVLLHALGKGVEVAESMMDVVSAVGGCGPAYLFELVAALTEAAVAAGVPAEAAALIVQETMLGSARLLEQTGASPDALRDRVTSPNGMTAAALRVLGHGGFRKLLHEAVAAATRRGAELSADG